MLLTGKTAIVTGSSRGIGKAIALRFAQEGCNIVVNYLRNDEKAKETINQLRELKVEVHDCQADIGKSSDVRKMVASSLDRFGKIDILVNNAGTGLAKPFETIVEDEWELAMSVHLKGVFLASQLVGEAMRKQGAGSIINIGSIAGQIALPNRAIYCTVEAGKAMFAKSLACEWAKWGIRVNTIAPGSILTDLMRRNFELGLLDQSKILERTPLGRLGEPAEIAAVALFLASSESSYITGQTLSVDGGWTSWGGFPMAAQTAKS